MARFVQCSVPEVAYLRGERIVNHPVNIDLCTKMRKDRERWYPDNKGLPCIRFDGCDAQWVFNTNELRDADYERLSKIGATKVE